MTCTHLVAKEEASRDHRERHIIGEPERCEREGLRV